MSDPENNWEPHDHEALVHAHRHYHVTHNYLEITGGFEHLSAAHDHAHDHAAVSHSHHPHENFEREHADEAHLHDHVAPVGGDGRLAPVKARKAPARKAAAAAQLGGRRRRLTETGRRSGRSPLR